MKPRKRPRRHLPLVIWSLIVAGLLLTPGDAVPDAGPWEGLDKPLHALLFGLHCALLARSLAASERRLPIAAGVSGLYGILLEAAQVWVPGRSWDAWDLVADFAGIAVAVLLITHQHARLRGAS